MLERSGVKLIAIDLDGTILNSQGVITEGTKRILKRIPGDIIIVSARALDNIKEVIKGINIKGIIYSNGSGIILDNQIVDTNYICYHDYQELLELIFKNYLDVSIKVKGDRNIFINLDNYHEIINNIEKITIKINNNYKLVSLIKKINKFNLDIVDGEYLILTNKGISKYKSLKKILHTLNIEKNQVMYFGNDLNDLELFKKLPLTVAVKNADSKIINEAAYICNSNDNDGVANFLKEYYFNNKEINIDNFNGGSVANVIYDKNNHSVKKSVSINNEGINNGYSKLFYEAKHMQQYNLKNHWKVYPEIYEIKEKHGYLVVEMEYLYHGVTLTDLLLNDKIGSKFINKSIEKIIDRLFQKMYLNKKNIVPRSDYLDINYFDRVANRIERVIKTLKKNNKYPRIKSAIRDGIYLNNKYYPSIIEYNNYLRNDKRVKEILMPISCTESHQDLIPSNIVTDYNGLGIEINNFKLIDPRGEGDTGLDTRHFTYDLGKLLFGLSGFEILRRPELKDNYLLISELKDNIYHYQFKIKDNYLTNKFKMARKCVLKELENNKYKYFDSINLTKTYQEKILLAEAYCFFADIPCRLINGDDEEILLTFYLRGMECLLEFIKLVYGKEMIIDDN